MATPTNDWIPLEYPADAHPCSFASCRHESTGALMALLWFGSTTNAGEGQWCWRLIDGTLRRDFPDSPVVFSVAEAELRRNRGILL